MVFSTIAENIKSFFHKEEEREHSPKKIPDAAIEVFEKPHDKHTIVTNKLAQKPAKIEEKKLPFTAAQLRESLKETPPAPPPRQELSPAEIEQQIREFETHISSMPGEDGSSAPITPPKSLPDEESLFHNFAKYLREQGYQFDDEAIPEDFIARMKTHHDERLTRKRFNTQSESIEKDISQKLTQLQSLEHDWVRKQEEAAAAQERMLELEDQISTNAQELREMVSRMRLHLSVPPQATQAGDRLQPSQYFRLVDGRLITSLGDLKSQLASMHDDIFYRHVTPERNDFAVWVAEAFKDNVLADKISHVRTKGDLISLLGALDTDAQ